MLLVRKIDSGTVIDHIPASKGIKVLSILEGLSDKASVLASNVPSTRGGKKDILKLEDVHVDETAQKIISLIAPGATINIIKNGEVAEKKKV